MDKNKKKLSYFSLRLQELLNTSFPEKSTDNKFIEQRSRWASNAYEGLFRSGNPIEECERIANHILFEGLHFSRFDTVFKVIVQEYGMLINDDQLHSFALELFPVCEPLFLGYELSEDFADSKGYDLLYTELTGAIAIWIEENGLQ